MNRLRVLKQRIRRAGDVGITKMDGGYVVGTGRFQGDCSPVLTKREAIHWAARWAMPSKPSILLASDGEIVNKITLYPDGRSTSVIRKLAEGETV